MFWLVLLLAQSVVPTQIERGEAIFTDPARGCAGCHALKGKGTAVGPDLRDISHLTPPGIAMAIRSTVTQYVQVIKLKSGRSFPAMPPKADQTYDLSKTPPETVSATAAEITSTTPNGGWRHPPSRAKFSSEDMADLIAYIRFAGANNRQPVSPSDIP
jgi:mono/diheme cytochrome c family protein